MTNILAGWKTYIAVFILVAVGVAKVAGVMVPGFENVELGTLFANALGLFGLRAAIANK